MFGQKLINAALCRVLCGALLEERTHTSRPLLTHIAPALWSAQSSEWTCWSLYNESDGQRTQASSCTTLARTFCNLNAHKHLFIDHFTPFQYLQCIASIGGIISEKWIVKDSPGGTEKNRRKPRRVKPISEPIFVPRTSQKWSGRSKHLAETFG
jgi:hypothetical protein